ncbi:MAG TPA: tetratricopeptide repeat protein [Planctomycetaceae bacterium]|nr:tetratricopeptide repeat protein [Planctomycetaceae bacterium]
MTIRLIRRLTVAAGLMATIGSTFAADNITRKSGPKLAGAITGTTKTELTIKPSVGDPVAVPANEIAIIDWDDATADLKLGVSDENGGRLDSALARVRKSKADSQTSSDALKKEFDFIEARIIARMAKADPSKVDEAIAGLEKFRKAGADHFRFYESLRYLGEVQMVKADYAAARQSFEGLSQAPWNDVKLSGQVSLGRILMAEGNADEAVRMFDAAIAAAGNSSGEQARKYDAMLGKARALAAQSKHEEALKTLDEVTMKAPATETALQAEAYVLQGNSLQAMNRNKEAVLAYLHVDLLFPRETAYHAESLFHMAKLWKSVNSPDRGLDAEAKLTASYPKSEWAKKLSGSAPQ